MHNDAGARTQEVMNSFSLDKVSLPLNQVRVNKTNKVYGDAPNRLDLVEKETRWDYADPAYVEGIKEDFSIDNSTHSIFGASKVAADVTGIRPLFPDADMLPAWWLSHRTESFRGRASWFSQLPHQVQPRGEDL